MTAAASTPTLDHPPPQRARAIVVVALVVGTALLAVALRLQRGSGAFYVVTILVALAWTLPSLVVAAPVTAGRWPWRTALIAGAVAGAVMFGVFVAAAAIGRHFSFLAEPIDRILRTADSGPLLAVLSVALVNGVAEELFFRGTLVTALGARRERSHVVALLVYVVVTAAGGNTALTLAAIVMGAVFALERWRSGGLVAPITTHLVWSTLMILAFPR